MTNAAITSLPVVILTGAGASKYLGKATTFDIYSAPEFIETTTRRQAFDLLMELRQMMNREDANDAIDLESLLDKVLEVVKQFDFLSRVPQIGDFIQRIKEQRDKYEEAREQALDFMVDYYGNIDRQVASTLYGGFFRGLGRLFTKYGGHTIPIFTLNYDDAVESAAYELPDYTLVDGFREGYPKHWDKSVFENYAPTTNTSIVLFKLHGSVSWTRPDGSDRIEQTIGVPRRRQGRQHVALFPTAAAKGINQDPFSTAYSYLGAALRQASVGVFIGTSFRDKELLGVISSRFRQDKPFTLVAVGPDVDGSTITLKFDSPHVKVIAVPLNFEPANISDILGPVATELEHLKS